MLPEELEEYMASLGEPRFRAKQVFAWLSKGVEDFAAMRNLPQTLRAKLEETCRIDRLKLLQKQVSRLDGTTKYLWELHDGNAVETVVMRYDYGLSVCISSQVGCAQGCAFCASTIGGLVRNLSASEMLDEVLYSQLDQGEKISHIVLMGIGEPLENYDALLRFLRLANHPDGLNIGMRHIAVSTLMPVNRGRGVESVIRACERYFEKTSRRVSFEYAMINGVNDSVQQAQALAALARRVKAHINLIPLNHVEERKLAPSTRENLQAFCRTLEEKGANYTIRRSLGGDVDASCGQLRRKREKNRTQGTNDAP